MTALNFPVTRNEKTGKLPGPPGLFSGSALVLQPQFPGNVFGNGIFVHHYKDGLSPQVSPGGKEIAVVNMIPHAPAVFNLVESFSILVSGQPGDMHQVVIGGYVIV